MSSTSMPRVVPAQLSFLALYNPSLTSSDETVEDQIVFYYSKATRARTRADGDGDGAEAAAALREQKNEQLRQVGLAQGMVGFARSFSSGDAVDSIETEKSRIVLYELEPKWWILASIDLTQLPVAAETTSKADSTTSRIPSEAVEYSSREVSPPALLTKQLVRANNIFLLHHGHTLEGLYHKLGRAKFCNTLDRYWSRFASRWDVLLHGSPAVDIFHGMKLAAGGELGMGVGEEEWGSGEREVLEDFARRTEGLVDIMVSRFGEPSPLQRNAKDPKDALITELEPWIGAGKSVTAGDGVIFSGVGALTRASLRDLSSWVEDIYLYGDYAYGVKDRPAADRRKRRRRNPDSEASIIKPQGTTTPDPAARSPAPPGIPPPIVTAAEISLAEASRAIDSKDARENGSDKVEPPRTPLDDTDTWMKYLTLGYGTAWGGKRTPSSEQPSNKTSTGRQEAAPDPPMRYVEPEPDVDRFEDKLREQVRQENSGYFIIGLKGTLDEADNDDEDLSGTWNNRILLRAVHVEVTDEIPVTPGTDSEQHIPTFAQDLFSKPKQKRSRLRAVVYVHRPFIYTFIFNQRTEFLSLASFYRNLHTYFAPLHRPLSASTSPARVHDRLLAASNPYTTIPTVARGPTAQPIYDLVYDPRSLTVHASLPNIPEPGTLLSAGFSASTSSSIGSWSRAEALNVHSQILATVASTRRTFSEIERTCKTNRGWWVVWMRLPPSSQGPPTPKSNSVADEAVGADLSDNADVITGGIAGDQLTKPEIEIASVSDLGFRVADLREAFLVRRANDGAARVSSVRSSGSSGMWAGLGMGMGLGRESTAQKMGGQAAGWGPRGLAEGIGIDARRYVEGLLSLNR